MSLKESTLRFIKQCRRVLHVSKKPDKVEYINVAKITGLGIIVIGIIGFIISIVAQLLGA
ncbi:MAG: protein translocase SEC61 complex subunit gamma [Euryarchaeota archaeon]|nr:protein translocase SEC61 complex subunit gamma [Euryarchaeota archaeon]MBU4607166.1 protein translocase SEC61 complex subunit gamma [Euryarchaeota archaeon]MBV1729766.1 protein translocase SEC61 complex subunit gamma [Methanobacterium sp.]MBV1755751.1 protein translocase SEC61 complex subunit gamma [Methanobacterium sp.]MBV1768029.1 protein translocase SEC61 complex subunit gamma [Methanobacterium sp.]